MSSGNLDCRLAEAGFGSRQLAPGDVVQIEGDEERVVVIHRAVVIDLHPFAKEIVGSGWKVVTASDSRQAEMGDGRMDALLALPGAQVFRDGHQVHGREEALV